MQGMVEATFAGDHQIKGKAEPQKAYRLMLFGREQLGSRQQ